MTLTSPSFPNGAQTTRTEREVRAARPLSMLSVIKSGADAAIAAEPEQITRYCPFCGSEPQLAAKVCNRFVVECSDEECGTARYGDTPEEAVKAWNTRAGVTV